MDEQTKTQAQALIRRGRVISSEIKSLGEELKDITGKLEDLLPIGFKDVVDGVECSRRDSNRAFDWKGYYATLSPEDKLDCLRSGLDKVDEKAVAKHAASAGKKEQFMVAPEVNKGILKLMP